MTDDSRILVVVDPTAPNDQACVDRGAKLAKSLDLGLELLICYYEHILLGARTVDSPFLQNTQRDAVNRCRKMLEEIARPLRDQGLSVVVSAVWDTPLGEAIVRHVLRTNPRIVVKDTHYHSKLRRSMFSNTDWNLVRTCPAPLWLAKPHSWPGPGRIVASVDPAGAHDTDSMLDRIILDEASFFANRLSCELHAFHSYLPISMYSYANVDHGEIPIDDIEKQMEQDHREKLEALLQDYDVRSERIHMMAGNPKQLLPDFAADVDAGLIVMGAIARNPLQRVFIGSTTEEVLDKLPCDLLVVKPAWFESSVKVTPPEVYQGTRDELPSTGRSIQAERRVEKAV